MATPFETPGAFSWAELNTTDVPAAKKFYSQLLGWELKDMDMGEMTYTVVNVGGQGVGGIMAIPSNAPPGTRPSWGNYVTVDNVDAVADRVKSLGGKVLMQPTDIPTVGRFAFIQDPQGATISLITYSPTMEK